MPNRFNAPLHGRGRLTLLACESGAEFARRVDTALSGLVEQVTGEKQSFLRRTEEIEFSNHEIKTVVNENIRGDDVYVIQCLDDAYSQRSVNDNLMALVTALHAADQSDAESITAVIPQFPYSRQERKKTREAITARVVAHLLEDAGADRVITLDIHAEAIMGFFDRCTLEDLHASAVIMDHVTDHFPTENMVVVAPDVGGADRARYYANHLGCTLAVVHKARDYSKASVIEEMRLVGDVDGKDVFMPDDLIATGGTLIKACDVLKSEGARRIYLACSLPFLNGKAIQLFDEHHAAGTFDILVGTDAVTRRPAFGEEHPWYHEVSVAPLFANVIFNVNQKQSVSKLLR